MPPVAVAADKRFRRAHHKPARKGRVNTRGVWLVARVVAMLVLALYGGWRGTALVLGAPALAVSHIATRGNQRLSRGEVLALLEGLRGRNILALDLDEWRERLLASSWVKQAHVRRVLPSGVEIEIEERRPIGVARLDDRLYLVGADGVVIDEYGPHYGDIDLPIIDGLSATPGEHAGAIDATRAGLAARVIEALAARPDLAAQVSQIDVSNPHDAVVILEGDTAMLRLGEDGFVERIQNYLDLAPALRDRVPQIDYVDLRFGRRVYVRPTRSQ